MTRSRITARLDQINHIRNYLSPMIYRAKYNNLGNLTLLNSYYNQLEKEYLELLKEEKHIILGREIGAPIKEK